MQRNYKFLFISINGDSIPICYRLEKIGYECYFYIHNGKDKSAGAGVLDNKVNDYHEVLQNHKQKDLIIVFDQNGLGYTADYLRRLGYKVINGGSFADKLENDREFGTELLASIMDVPETTKFTEWDKAKEFLSKQEPDARFVFKPSGVSDSAKTYVSKDVEDMINELEYYESIWGDQEGDNVDFELQEFIPGTEVSFSGYFNGERFIENAYTLTIEEKKFMDKNIGPAVGCAGNIIFYMDGKEKYIHTIFNKLTPELKKMGYIGQIDINNIFSNEDGIPRALEFTPRWGYDSVYTEMLLLGPEKFAEFLINLAYKKDFATDFFPVGKRALSVRLTVPPYPGGHGMSSGQRISFPDEYLDNIFLEDVKFKDDGHVTCGIDGIICNVCSVGDTVEECKKIVYEDILPKIKIPDVQYRTDIGDRTESDLEKIKEWL